VFAALVHDVNHSVELVCGAKFTSSLAFIVENGLLGATLMNTPLVDDVDHSIKFMNTTKKTFSLTFMVIKRVSITTLMHTRLH
jgi:hypothetical protein